MDSLIQNKLLKNENKVFLCSTINSFQTIPPVKQFVSYFSQFGEIIGIENKINGYEDFFVNAKSNLKIICYKNVKEFHNQSLENKVQKYFINLYLMLKSESESGSSVIFYCNDILVLLFIILFKSKRSSVIYHQFEMIEFSKLNKIDRTSLRIIASLNKSVDLVITPEKNRTEFLRNILKIKDESKMLTIPNSNNNVISIREDKITKNDEKIVVTHVGAVGLSHHIKNYLEAISTLDQTLYEFRFIGLLTDDVIDLINSYKDSSIIYLGQVLHSDLKKYYLETDLGVILYKDVSLNHRFCAPNKLYEYWSYGIPVLGDKLPGLEGVFTEPFLGELINMNIPSQISNAISKLSLNNNKQVIADFFQSHLKLDNYLEELSSRLARI